MNQVLPLDLRNARWKCNSDDDRAGAIRELVRAVFLNERSGDHYQHPLLPGKPSHAGPGIDPDAQGYGCNARRELEDCR